MLVRLSNNNLNATLMKNDKHVTVNVDRIRPYDTGIESIEDQHKRDIELADAELSVIIYGSTSWYMDVLLRTMGTDSQRIIAFTIFCC